jgi:hypothetical protein
MGAAADSNLPAAGVAGVAVFVVLDVDVDVGVAGGGSVADDDGRAPRVPSRCRVPYYQSA